MESKRYLYSLDGLGGLWLSISILVIETLIILLGPQPLRITSVESIVKPTPQSLVLVTYFISVFAVPALFAWRTGISRELADVQRYYAPKALVPIRISVLKKRISLVIVFIPLSTLSILIGLLYSIPYLYLVSLLPILTLMYMMLRPHFATYRHRSQVEQELCWFIVLLTLSESVGAGWGYLSRRLTESNILPAIARELRVIDRDAKVYFPSHIDAMIHRASVTPSERFGRLLAGYASRIRSSSDVVSWLRAWLYEEFMHLELSFRLFAERTVSLVGQLALAIYAILPLISIGLATVMDLNLVTSIAIIATPLLTALAYALRPHTMDRLNLRSLIASYLVLITVAIALYPIIGVFSLVLGWCLSLIPSFKLYLELREVDSLQTESLELLRDILELRRSGYSIPTAIRYLSRSPSYSPAMRKYLAKVAQLLELGTPLTRIVNLIKSPSFMFKYTLFSLGFMQECGGGNLEAIQHLYESLRRMNALINSVKKTSLFFDSFAIANSVIVVLISKLISGMCTTLSLLPTLLTKPEPTSIALLLLVAALGYSTISTTVRRGVPLPEPRQGAFLGVAALMSILI